MQPTWIVEGAGYIVENNRPIVNIYARNYNNKFETKHFAFKNFKPYFYAPLLESNITLPTFATYKESTIDALGREVIKVETNLPSQVAEIRDLFSFTDMSDFLFEKRFLVDHHIKYAFKVFNDVPYGVEVDSILEPRIVYYDIEVVSPKGIFPSPLDTLYEIASIQCMDSYTEKIVVFTNGIPQTSYNEHIACKSEVELYELFFTYLSDINPDVITAYNSNGFDLPYIIRRSFKNKINVNRLSRQGKARCIYDPETGHFDTKIGYRSTLDMLEALKKITVAHAQRESYALKSVISDAELLDTCVNLIDKKCKVCKSKCENYKSCAFSYTDLGPILEDIMEQKRYDDFIEYCKNDVIALKTIDRSLGIFDFYTNICKISGCFLDDTMYNSKIIEMLLLHEGIKPCPRKNQFQPKTGDSIEGAYVVPPTPGVTEYCGTFDLASLYPNIIIFYNLSPDIDHIVANTLKKTLQMREDLRSLCKKNPDDKNLENQQSAIKVINNSYYGVLCLKSFRLYNKEIAEKITSTGRELNHYLQSLAKSKGLNIIGGDSVAYNSTVSIYSNDVYQTVPISSLFTHTDYTIGTKEYCVLHDVSVKTLSDDKKIIYKPITYIMRHKTTKQMYRVKSRHNHIDVTQDHSLINYNLQCVTPQNASHFITSNTHHITIEKCRTKQIAYNNYVYDIEVEDTHRFFANNILVHNTDAVIISPITSKDVGKSMESYLNDGLHKWSRERNGNVDFKLKFEKLYRRLLYKSEKSHSSVGIKKKYCGYLIWEEGRDKSELNYKGLELKRSDQSNITRECLQFFLEEILINGNIDKAVQFIKEKYKDVCAGNIDPFKISIPKAVRKINTNVDNPWIRGIYYAKQNYNYIIAEGEKPRLIYLKNNSEICIDEDFDTSLILHLIDFKLMADKTIKQKMESYIWSINYDWDAIVNGQKSLGDFF